MPKKDLSGAAKYSKELSIALNEELDKIKFEFYQNLYQEIPKRSGNAAKELSVSRTRRDGRKIWIEFTLSPYMWEVWRGGDRYIDVGGGQKMRFPESKWPNGPTGKYIKFKYGYYRDGFYTFKLVHHKVDGVEGTSNDFIQNAFDKLDLSKFTQGIVTKMNNKRIYL